MDRIGLSSAEMTSLMIMLKTQLSKDQEPQIQQHFNNFIEQGCSREDAETRATIIGFHSIDISAILGVIASNNERILSDLKDAGLIE